MAQKAVQLAITSTPALIWATTTGVSPDIAVNPAGQVFQAGVPTDPLPITIENTGATAVYLGGSGVAAGTGLELPAGGSLTRNVIGNDSEYAVCASTGTVAVEVGRQ